MDRRIGRLPFLFLLLASLIPSGIEAQTKKPITKSGLIKALQIHGLSARELTAQISSRGVDFALTPEVESELKAAGATPDVIEAVRAHSPVLSAPPPPRVEPSKPPITTQPAPVNPPPPQRRNATLKPGIYTRQNDEMKEIFPESVNWRREGKIRKFTVGLGKGEFVGLIPGASSPNVVHVPITFVISLPTGANIGDYTLVLIREKKGVREVRVGSSDSRSIVPFNSRKVNNSTYEVDFSQGAGGYAFLPAANADQNGVPYSPQIYTFRVQ